MLPNFIFSTLDIWPTVLPVAKDVITIAAAVVGIIVAISGLDAWKKQLKGKTDYELARRYLRAVLKLRDALQSVRHPMITAGEFSQAKKVVKDDGESEDIDENIAVYIVRWKLVTESLSDLQVESFEAQVSWGKEILRLEKPMKQLIRELNVHLMLSLDKNLEPKEKIESRKYIYNSGDDNNPDQYTRDLNGAIENIEKFLTKFLK